MKHEKEEAFHILLTEYNSAIYDAIMCDVHAFEDDGEQATLLRIHDQLIATYEEALK